MLAQGVHVSRGTLQNIETQLAVKKFDFHFLQIGLAHMDRVFSKQQCKAFNSVRIAYTGCASSITDTSIHIENCGPTLRDTLGAIRMSTNPYNEL